MWSKDHWTQLKYSFWLQEELFSAHTAETALFWSSGIWINVLNIWSHRYLLFFFLKCLWLCFHHYQIKFTDNRKTTTLRLFRGSDGICKPHYQVAPEIQLLKVFSCIQVMLDPFLVSNQNCYSWNCRCWKNDCSWISNVTGTVHRYSTDNLALVKNFRDILLWFKDSSFEKWCFCLIPIDLSQTKNTFSF